MQHSPLKTQPASPRDGAVLVLVLVVIAVLTLGAYTFSELMISESDATAMFSRQSETRAFADSGIELIAAVMGNPESDDDRNLFHNSSRLGAITIRQADSSRGRGLVTVIAPIETDSTSKSVRIGVCDESAKLNLNQLLSYKLDETQTRLMLMSLPNMTEDIADAILDWVDDDDIPREFGVESEYYEGLPQPYSAANKGFQSLDELLKVADVTPDLLYGEDVNRNGLLDPNEDDGDLSPPFDNKDGILQLGWNAFLTIDAQETNLRLDGTKKINLNDGLLTELYDKLVEEFDDEGIARYVVALRMNGPKPDPNQQQQDSDRPTNGTSSSAGGESQAAAGRTGSGTSSSNSGQQSRSTSGSQNGNSRSANSGSGSSGSNNSSGGGSSGGGSSQPSQGQLAEAANTLGKAISGGVEGAVTRGGMNLAAGAKYEIKSIFELIGTTVVAQVDGKETELVSPWDANPPQMQAYIDKLYDTVTTYNDAAIQGRINVGEARYEVLMGIPGMTEAIASAIVQSTVIGADGSANLEQLKQRATPAWLVTQGILDLPTLVKVSPYVTSRGSVARAQVVGFFQEGSGYTRLEVVIDATEAPAKILSVRDLTDLGRGYSTNMLLGTNTRSGP